LEGAIGYLAKAEAEDVAVPLRSLHEGVHSPAQDLQPSKPTIRIDFYIRDAAGPAGAVRQRQPPMYD
jgi:hypothetical protein